VFSRLCGPSLQSRTTGARFGQQRTSSSLFSPPLPNQTVDRPVGWHDYSGEHPGPGSGPLLSFRAEATRATRLAAATAPACFPTITGPGDQRATKSVVTQELLPRAWLKLANLTERGIARALTKTDDPPPAELSPTRRGYVRP